MTPLFDALAHHAQTQADKPAVIGSRWSLNYGELQAAVDTLAKTLTDTRVGLALDNSPAWVVCDLALLRNHALCVPIPLFFSPQQVAHLVSDAQLDAVITEHPETFTAACPGAVVDTLEIGGQPFYRVKLHGTTEHNPVANTAKVTYTSGTTGNPKGVCLSAAAMQEVSEALQRATAATVADKSLSLLPLGTLLENIAGVYVPLLAGGTCTVPSLADVGMRGAAGVDVPTMAGAIQQHQPTALVLVPQLLQGLVEICESGFVPPAGLRFVAVGGAPVSATLLERASHAGLPVFEGYGLSEAGSVVSVNTPDAHTVGSVGKPLSHLRVRIAEDGEILVSGRLCEGYLGGTPRDDAAWLATGDLGYLDAAGYLYLTGRKKNQFATAYGRNVAPEWVERELLTSASIAQAAVFGDTRPYNVAVIVPRPGADAESLQSAIDAANIRLPDYARVSRYTLAGEPFSIQNTQLTGTGRPRRAVIETRYKTAIAALYDEVTA